MKAFTLNSLPIRLSLSTTSDKIFFVLMSRMPCDSPFSIMMQQLLNKRQSGLCYCIRNRLNGKHMRSSCSFKIICAGQRTLSLERTCEELWASYFIFSPGFWPWLISGSKNASISGVIVDLHHRSHHSRSDQSKGLEQR